MSDTPSEERSGPSTEHMGVPTPGDTSPPIGTRRSFFQWITAVASGLIALGLGVPLIGYVIAPALKRRERPWVDVGAVADLAVEKPTQLEYQETIQDGWLSASVQKGVWVVKHEGDHLTCFAPLCTHLGCGFDWDGAAGEFKCPCHGSVFDKDGRVKAGPAPRPLDVLPARVENGRLHVQYKEFKAGLSRKVEI